MFVSRWRGNAFARWIRAALPEKTPPHRPPPSSPRPTWRWRSGWTTQRRHAARRPRAHLVVRQRGAARGRDRVDRERDRGARRAGAGREAALERREAVELSTAPTSAPPAGEEDDGWRSERPKTGGRARREDVHPGQRRFRSRIDGVDRRGGSVKSHKHATYFM